ncbi:hypothetical protein B0H11DRAFT_2052587 [Mycena galericulata]|nr:hypothetical protein B0H11DRAFT_2052587 [Mycena galericulata]
MSTAEIQAQLNSSYYLSAISFTILFYDYFLTLHWGTKITWPTGLFFANRYGTLLGNIPIVFQSFWTTPGTPNKLRWGTLSSGKAASNGPGLLLYIGCTYEITHAQSIGLVIAWASLGGFDCMIFFLTLYRALSQRHLTGLKLITVLLRDGTFVKFPLDHFSRIGRLFPMLLTLDRSSGHTRGVATTFTNIISSIMISRLMLNLRDPALSRISTRFSESTRGVDADGVFTSYLTPSGAVEIPRTPARRSLGTEMSRDVIVGLDTP